MIMVVLTVLWIVQIGLGFLNQPLENGYLLFYATAISINAICLGYSAALMRNR